MFKKILIANRGEIACRVIRTARRLGIATVAVHSDADEEALHVRMADEAVRIGPPPAAQSYLDIKAILKAVKDTGAEAVHPGYGFLAENQAFAKALAKAGVVFIGPDVKAIAAMGDKIESKRLAARAGVSTVPGHAEVIPDARKAVKIAREIGYPVMIKASAGGGGKGMRIARDDDEVTAGFRSAASEARSSFGDDRLLIEKYIEEPRHIEIQVLADSHGNVIHLGERECSIQRRHQKVIEEAPSPALDASTRAAMGAQAVALAAAVGYRSAGTVEFIMGGDREFYFLEMNTRLQVEHPVTELVTGLDLVEQMLRVAAGETLEIAQKDVKLEGWAIEARVYAEDPQRNFLPSVGRLVRFRPPPESESVRVDTGVFEGGEIGIHYDPMIAKLITGGADRGEAIARARLALDAFYVRGVRHNIGFLSAVLAHPRFVAGRLSTDFIAEAWPDGFSGAELSADDKAVLIAVAATVHRYGAERAARTTGRMPERAAAAGRDWVVCLGAEQHPVSVTLRDDGADLGLGKSTHAVRSDWRPGEPIFRGSVDGREVRLQVDGAGAGFRLSYAGAEAEVTVLTPRAAELARRMPAKEAVDSSRFLLSPMPGLLVSIAVKPGQKIKAGEELAVVEAMKMENILRAEHDCTIAALHAGAGDSLAVDQAILEFE